MLEGRLTELDRFFAVCVNLLLVLSILSISRHHRSFAAAALFLLFFFFFFSLKKPKIHQFSLATTKAALLGQLVPLNDVRTCLARCIIVEGRRRRRRELEYKRNTMNNNNIKEGRIYINTGIDARRSRSDQTRWTRRVNVQEEVEIYLTHRILTGKTTRGVKRTRVWGLFWWHCFRACSCRDQAWPDVKRSDRFLLLFQYQTSFRFAFRRSCFQCRCRRTQRRIRSKLPRERVSTLEDDEEEHSLPTCSDWYSLMKKAWSHVRPFSIEQIIQEISTRERERETRTYHCATDGCFDVGSKGRKRLIREEKRREMRTYFDRIESDLLFAGTALPIVRGRSARIELESLWWLRRRYLTGGPFQRYSTIGEDCRLFLFNRKERELKESSQFPLTFCCTFFRLSSSSRSCLMTRSFSFNLTVISSFNTW